MNRRFLILNYILSAAVYETKRVFCLRSNTRANAYTNVSTESKRTEMYTLLHGFYKYLTQKDEFCVLILGLDNAGKTVILDFSTKIFKAKFFSDRWSVLSLQTYLESSKTKFKKNYKGINPSKITTTVGLNIGNIDVHRVSLNFWDLGGQTELQSLWDKVYAWILRLCEYFII